MEALEDDGEGVDGLYEREPFLGDAQRCCMCGDEIFSA